MNERPTIAVMATKENEARSARDARDMAYGERDYWEYLEHAAKEARDFWLRQGDAVRAREMMTRTLSEALAGNEGP